MHSIIISNFLSTLIKSIYQINIDQHNEISIRCVISYSTAIFLDNEELHLKLKIRSWLLFLNIITIILGTTIAISTGISRWSVHFESRYYILITYKGLKHCHFQDYSARHNDFHRLFRAAEDIRNHQEIFPGLRNN